MKEKSQKIFLRRYTDILGLIYLLSNKKITLLDPEDWDDSNDSHYLKIYKEKKNLKSVLALCFTQVDETYHHWHVFANGASGVCIQFDREILLKEVDQYEGIFAKEVTYLKLEEIRDRKIKVDELPFLKRYAFEHEYEFRIIYEAERKERKSLDIDIDLSSIRRITLSPWAHPNLVDDLKKLLKKIDGCSDLKIVRSTLIGNAEWKKLGDGATVKKKTAK